MVGRGARRGPAVLVLLGLVGALLVAGPTGGAAAGPTVAPAVVAGPGQGGVGRAAGRPPNFILITTDDQALTDMRWMPRTRRLLGKAGVTFRRGISPHPLCCPARANILTGQYAQNNGVRDNSGRHGGFESLEDPDNTVAAWLQRSGYRTGFVGKYLNLYYERHGRQGGWDVWNPLVGNTVYRPYAYRFFDGWPGREPQPHVTDAVRDQTVDLIDRWSGSGAPFFIYASYVAPHGLCTEEKRDCSAPPVPPERYADAYPGARNPARTKPSFNEAKMGDKPRWMRGRAKQSPAYMQKLFHARVRSLAAVDEAVAATVEALRRNGELDNTYLLFTSDNGYMLGEHRFEEKIFAYQESVRVPFLLRGPGVPAGVRRPQVVSTIDIAPTVVDATGARAGRLVDGESMLPYARQKRRMRRTSLVQAGPRGKIGTRQWTFRGAYTPRYTYVRWSKTGFEELYDRRRDPHELQSVARRKRYAPVRRELRRRMRVLRTCVAEVCSADFGPQPKPRKKRRKKGRVGGGPI